MVSNLTMDQYTLELEAFPNPSEVRAIATNLVTRSTVEAQLSPDQVRALLMHAYGGEQPIVENYIEQINAGHTVEVLATSKDRCVFTPHELAQFGFAPEELEG